MLIWHKVLSFYLKGRDFFRQPSCKKTKQKHHYIIPHNRTMSEWNGTYSVGVIRAIDKSHEKIMVIALAVYIQRGSQLSNSQNYQSS